MKEDIFLKNWRYFKTKVPHKLEPYSKRNWGSSLHSLCSYQGKMKPSLVYHLINLFSNQLMRLAAMDKTYGAAFFKI